MRAKEEHPYAISKRSRVKVHELVFEFTAVHQIGADSSQDLVGFIALQQAEISALKTQLRTLENQVIAMQQQEYTCYISATYRFSFQNLTIHTFAFAEYNHLPWIRHVYASCKHNKSSFITKPEEISLDSLQITDLSNPWYTFMRECIVGGIELQPGSYTITRCYKEYNRCWANEHSWKTFTGIRYVSAQDFQYLEDFPMKHQNTWHMSDDPKQCSYNEVNEGRLQNVFKITEPTVGYFLIQPPSQQQAQQPSYSPGVSRDKAVPSYPIFTIRKLE
jgi:hypothetical protein